MAKHQFHKPELGRPTTVETKESSYGDKDVALTIWQGVYGHTTDHSWEELQQLHSEIGTLLRSAGQEASPEQWEYTVQVRHGDRDHWISWTNDTRHIWGTKERMQQYLESWRGKPDWTDLQYRVFRRTKAGRVQTVAEGTGHDTAPASF